MTIVPVTGGDPILLTALVALLLSTLIGIVVLAALLIARREMRADLVAIDEEIEAQRRWIADGCADSDEGDERGRP